MACLVGLRNKTNKNKQQKKVFFRNSERNPFYETFVHMIIISKRFQIEMLALTGPLWCLLLMLMLWTRQRSEVRGQRAEGVPGRDTLVL